MGYWYLYPFVWLLRNTGCCFQPKKIKGLKIKNTSFWISCLLMFCHCSDWKICVVKFGKLVCPKLMMFEWLEQFVRWKGGLVSKSDNGEGIEAGEVAAWWRMRKARLSKSTKSKILYYLRQKQSFSLKRHSTVPTYFFSGYGTHPNLSRIFLLIQSWPFI